MENIQDRVRLHTAQDTSQSLEQKITAVSVTDNAIFMMDTVI
jgi:hypothetical protein